MVLDDNNQVTLEHFVNVLDETINMRITYTGDEHRWIGMGVNTAGSMGMTPALVVIGRDEGKDDDDNNDDDESSSRPSTTSVHRYSLTSDSRDASGVTLLDDVHGHLKPSGSSFVQFTTEDGARVSVLEFTHDLVVRDDTNFDKILYQIVSAKTGVNGTGTAHTDTTAEAIEDDERSNDDGFDDDGVDDDNEGTVSDEGSNPPNVFAPVSTRWIWAVGGSNNRWRGAHRLHGSFLLTLDENNCLMVESDAPSTAPSTTPSDEPSMAPSTIPTVTVDGGTDYPSSSPSDITDLVGTTPSSSPLPDENDVPYGDVEGNSTVGANGALELESNDTVGNGTELDQNLSSQDPTHSMIWVSGLVTSFDTNELETV
jgi:hypothetical protein